MKSILVTGANKGIGLSIVAATLRSQRDSLVFLGSRNLERGQAARRQQLLENADWSDRIVALEMDVTNDYSVSSAADALLSRIESGNLYAVVNNAGMGQGSVAQVMDVNLHGIRRVSDCFAPLISTGGRVVNVTSASAPNFVSECTPERQAFFCNPDISWEELAAFIERCGELDRGKLHALGLGSESPYGFSKACANSYTLWLARKYPELFVNACTPGFIETELGKKFLGSRTPAEAGMKPPDAGAKVVLELLFGAARVQVITTAAMHCAARWTDTAHRAHRSSLASRVKTLVIR